MQVLNIGCLLFFNLFLSSNFQVLLLFFFPMLDSNKSGKELQAFIAFV